MNFRSASFLLLLSASLVGLAVPAQAGEPSHLPLCETVVGDIINGIEKEPKINIHQICSGEEVSEYHIIHRAD